MTAPLAFDPPISLRQYLDGGGNLAACGISLEAFIRRHVILPADTVVASMWAEIHAAVRDQVDVNDEWTAAAALAQHPPIPIATGNLKHFAPIAARFPALVVAHPAT